MFQLSLVLKQVFISPLTLAFQRIFFQFPFTEPQDKKEGMLENSVFKNNGAECTRKNYGGGLYKCWVSTFFHREREICESAFREK